MNGHQENEPYPGGKVEPGRPETDYCALNEECGFLHFNKKPGCTVAPCCVFQRSRLERRMNFMNKYNQFPNLMFFKNKN